MIAYTRLQAVEPSTVARINSLLRQLSSQSPRASRGTLIAVLRNKEANVLLVLDGKKVIGMGTIIFIRTITGVHARIETVVIDQNYRSQGIGSKLVMRLIRIARQQRAKYIELTSHASRIAANRMYQKIGFQRRETNVYRLLL